MIKEYSLEHEPNRSLFNDNFIRQSEEASLIKPKINATAGVLKSEGKLVAKDSVMSFYAETSPEKVVGYSPILGIDEVRGLWRDRILKHNDLIQSNISLPIVTAGITAALAVANELFLGPNSRLFLPKMRWEAYDSIFKAAEKIIYYDPYLMDLPFEKINGVYSDDRDIRFVVVLNYPHNPTGWSPSEEDLKRLGEIFVKIVSSGRKIVVIADDAYTGLFFEDSIQSPFAYFCNLDKRILAVKCDGASKECLMWGQRIGFLTFGIKDGTIKDYNYLENEAKSIIRGLYSSPCTASQYALFNSELSPLCEKENNDFKNLLLLRYLEFKRVIESLGRNEFIYPLPFNSGYFMCFEVKCDAEVLRKKLLHEKGIGIIAYDKNYIRVAWSSVDYKNIEELITVIYEAAKELYERGSY